MNKVFLRGNLTRDVESGTTSSGQKWAKFTLAVNREYAKDGEHETDFINIVAWRSTAETCAKYLAKGRNVIVEGSLQVRSYETEKGDKRSVTEVLASRIEFVGSKQSDADTKGENKAQQLGMDEIDDDDLPF